MLNLRPIPHTLVAPSGVFIYIYGRCFDLVIPHTLVALSKQAGFCMFYSSHEIIFSTIE